MPTPAQPLPPDAGELTYFDDLVRNAVLENQEERIPRSEVLRVPVPNPESNTTPATIRVAHLLALMPESRNGLADDVDSTVEALVALRDFNRRQSIFPTSTLTQDTQGCDLYLRMSIRDSGRAVFQAGQAWQEAFFAADNQTEFGVQGPMAVVGAASSHVSATVATLAAATPATNKDNNSSESPNIGIVQVSPRSSAVYLEDPVRYPYFARTISTTTRGAAEAIMLYLNSIDVRQVSILHVDDGFALDMVQQLLQHAKHCNQNLRQIRVVSYVERDGASMAKAAALLKQDAMVYHIGISLSKDMILQLYDNGLLGQHQNSSENTTASTATTNTAWTFFGKIVRQSFSEQAGNHRRMADVHRALDRSVFVQSSNADWTKDTEKINTEILKQGMLQFRNDSAALDYVLARHHGKGLFATNPQTFRQLLHSSSYPRASLYTYDAVLALGIAACKTPSFESRTFYQTLIQQQFSGASFDSVAFDETGTRLSDDFIAFKFFNLAFDSKSNSSNQNDGAVDNYYVTKVNTIHALTFARDPNCTSANATMKPSHLNNPLKLWSVETPVIYLDGTTQPPQSIPPAVENMHLAPWELQVFCWVMAGVVILLSLVSSLWILRKRNQPNIVANQPVFLVLTCAGTFLLGLSILPLTWQEPMTLSILNVGCMLHVWLLSIGFSTTFAVLFTRTWRINLVLSESMAFRRSQVEVSRVIWVPIAVLGVNVTLLTLWNVLEPLEWKRLVIEEDTFGRSIESRGTCWSLDSYVSKLFGSLLALFNFSAFCVVGVQSYRSRLLPNTFNETLPVSFAIGIILEAFLIGIPLLTVLKRNVGAFMVVASWITAVSAMAVLLPLVVYKIIGSSSAQQQVTAAELLEAVQKSRRQLASDDGAPSSLSSSRRLFSEGRNFRSSCHNFGGWGESRDMEPIVEEDEGPELPPYGLAIISRG
jgi:7 transmembrane sweet-taste receptor of 3 GCPR/Receptor family ligand binding region